MSEQKNMFLAIALSLGVFLGFNYFFPTKPAVQPEPTSIASTSAPDSASVPSVPGANHDGTAQLVKAEASLPMTREQALAETPRIKINSPKIHGSINLKGARIDDVTLIDYHETTDPKSPEIVLLSPNYSMISPEAGSPGRREPKIEVTKSENPYFADFGWLSGASNISVPSSTTLWKANQESLSVDKPLILTWDNGQGCLFERTISIDNAYMFTVTDRVINKTDQSFKINSYGQITRMGTPATGGYFILHEGPIGVLNGKLTELDYSKLMEKGAQDQATTGGWLGITDKYWLVSLIPDQKTSYHTRFKGQKIEGKDRYQTEAISPEFETAPGATTEVTYNLFVGAKVLRTLDGYEEKLGFSKFDLAVDFGWFYFLTKPLFYLLEYLHKILGNLGLAILVMTVMFKVVLFPLANKSYRSMSRMKTLQPKMEALKQRFGNDKMRMNQEIMELYKKEQINPLSGCLPMVIQAPLFFCLYKVLFVTIEMRHAPFYGWIHDLSAPDPTSFFNLFGLLPFDPPSFLMIGAWPLLMGLTMFLQQKMNPQPADPAQATMFMIMPVMMTFLLASFPAGLVIYWAWNNILSIAQQWYIMRLEANRTPGSKNTPRNIS